MFTAFHYSLIALSLLVKSPLSFLILMICLDFFISVNLAKGLSILLILKKKKPLVSLIYCVFVLLHLLLVFIHFLLPALGFVCSSFSSALRWKVKSLIWDLFLIYIFMATHFQLSTVLMHPIVLVVSSFWFISKYYTFDFFSDQLDIQLHFIFTYL